jgi:hypothetical protein
VLRRSELRMIYSELKALTFGSSPRIVSGQPLPARWESMDSLVPQQRSALLYRLLHNIQKPLKHLIINRER